jgi:hypothetical protein
MLNTVTPFFIVDDLGTTLEFYQSRLGFNVLHQGGDGQGNDFWAILGRDQVMLMFKAITPEVIGPWPTRVTDCEPSRSPTTVDMYCVLAALLRRET